MEEALGRLLRPCIESRHAYQALKSLATHKTERACTTTTLACVGQHLALTTKEMSQ